MKQLDLNEATKGAMSMGNDAFEFEMCLVFEPRKFLAGIAIFQY